MVTWGIQSSDEALLDGNKVNVQHVPDILRSRGFWGSKELVEGRLRQNNFDSFIWAGSGIYRRGTSFLSLRFQYQEVL